ncbi:hypothetical protein [Vibrio sp. V19_P1S1T109]|uniref:hypothetical protein n=1 Tax=Vibrio sp. V19_P1S1T109 TaxID=1938672 RepID=UPI00159553B1|nr:hypothetical protein [Vibrio sp. V19_P1S1T109]
MKKPNIKTDDELLRYLDVEIKKSDNVKPIPQLLIDRMIAIKLAGDKAKQRAKLH